jgi:RimJ/RimL family protein N-acetyltransferase
MMSTLRLSLLPWKPGDWRQLTPLVTDPVVMRHITGGEAWSDAQTQAFVGRQRALHRSRGFCFWKLHEAASGTFVGFCGLQPLRHHDLIEVGWWLARDRWGLGLATEAARAAVADGFTRLDLARIVAITRPANTRSRAVMVLPARSAGSGRRHGRGAILPHCRDSWARRQRRVRDATSACSN